MPPIGFEPAISADEWPKTHALDSTATGTGLMHNYLIIIRNEKGKPNLGDQYSMAAEILSVVAGRPRRYHTPASSFQN